MPLPEAELPLRLSDQPLIGNDLVIADVDPPLPAADRTDDAPYHRTVEVVRLLDDHPAVGHRAAHPEGGAAAQDVPLGDTEPLQVCWVAQKNVLPWSRVIGERVQDEVELPAEQVTPGRATGAVIRLGRSEGVLLQEHTAPEQLGIRDRRSRQIRAGPEAAQAGVLAGEKRCDLVRIDLAAAPEPLQDLGERPHRYSPR